MTEDLVRIKYWLQETLESGRFVLTRPMTKKGAKTLLNSGLVESGEIVSAHEEKRRFKCIESGKRNI